jgi:flagellin-like protein
MRKLLKSRKALSPVVAAIILIAVTVAVSIAVAAWMGSLTIGFMETSELTVTQMRFTGAHASGLNGTTITLDVTNSGTSAVTVSLVKVNGETMTTVTGDLSLEAGDPGNIVITQTWYAGNKYSVSLFTSDGTLVGSYTDTA